MSYPTAPFPLAGKQITPLHRHFTGEANVVMDQLAAAGEKFDLILTDPPWYVPTRAYPSRLKGKQSGSPGRRWSDVFVMQAWWRDTTTRLRAVNTDKGHSLVFCGGSAVAAFYPPLYENWKRVQIVTWDKMVLLPGFPFRQNTEIILAATANTAGYRNPEATKVSTVLFCKFVPPNARTHPAQKPQALLEQLIDMLCPPGGRVLDPFCGSGSTAHAAQALGREVTTIDVDPAFPGEAE